jgi:tetratricopeptide (TPR) repeat protein
MSRDDDLLERATRALRATPPPNDGELAQAKLRLLAAHRAATKPSRGRSLRWVLPLAAVLAAGSALAAVPNGMERLTQAVSDLFTPSAPAQPKPKPKRSQLAKSPSPRAPGPVPAATPASVATPAPMPAAAPAPGVAAAPAPGVAAAPTTVPALKRRRARAEPREQPAQAAATQPVAPPTPVAEPVAPAPVEPTPSASADLAKYRAAHKAHFQQRDFALALRNWEAYLRQYPNGTFAVEARYNRAICLLRLNRKDEARRALTPFAHGEIGHGYRQAEATKLLEALE